MTACEHRKSGYSFLKSGNLQDAVDAFRQGHNEGDMDCTIALGDCLRQQQRCNNDSTEDRRRRLLSESLSLYEGVASKERLDEDTVLATVCWDFFDGPLLDEALQSGAIALIDASWLVRFAISSKMILPRQKLPAQAFLSYKQIRAASRQQDSDVSGLRLIALSYMWLHPDHPDPKGHTLSLVSQVLLTCIRGCLQEESSSRWAIFWDYASLHQHPDPRNGVLRTLDEEKLFRQGLNSLSLLYAHPHTFVFKITKLPYLYPEGYNLPAGANTADYRHRGWTCTESSLAGLVKSHEKVLDISLFTDNKDPRYGLLEVINECTVGQHRRAPRLPQRFVREINQCSFTNGKNDLPLCIRLYTESFKSSLAPVRFLHFEGLEWTDEDMRLLEEVMCGGFLPNLEVLQLSDNDIGTAGCQCIFDALVSGQSPKIRELDLSMNENIGDKGTAILAETIGVLEAVNLSHVNMTYQGCQLMANAILRSRAQANLVQLHLLGNPIHDAGCEALLPLILHCTGLRRLSLDGRSVKQTTQSMLESASHKLSIHWGSQPGKSG